MKTKKLLAAFLLGVGLCFVPTFGYGEVKEWMDKSKASYMDVELLKATISYMTRNPASFLDVSFSYDPRGTRRKIYKLPESVSTKGKICVLVGDNRNVFSYKSGIALQDQFKRSLEIIYSYITVVATDMDTDIVARFYTREEIPLGYFYQGEYHLWED